MGKKHFTVEQIAFALRQADSGTSVAEIVCKLTGDDVAKALERVTTERGKP